MQKDLYAVIGNPVSHSLSPIIHQQFARQSDQSLSYQAIELPLDGFKSGIGQLRDQGFKGLNVTVPFKRLAWEACQQLSPTAKLAGAVNCLSLNENDQLIGDNTDGLGLVSDLINNHKVELKQKNILILGAGGAVRGVLAPLLQQLPKRLVIANRSVENAQALQKGFSSLGKIEACGYPDLGGETFDLIINGTSAGLNNEMPAISESILRSDSVCYDMMYKIDEPTCFTRWAMSQGIQQSFDGLGMLVEQAAESFFIWRGVRVDSAAVIDSLRPKKLQ